MEPVLREDMQKIWDSVPKPQAHKETPPSEFFNVEFVALSSYEEKGEQFKEQVMVATVHCKEIANEKFSSFIVNEEWRQLELVVQSQPVPGFGRKLTSIIDVCLSGYSMRGGLCGITFDYCCMIQRPHTSMMVLNLVSGNIWRINFYR